MKLDKILKNNDIKKIIRLSKYLLKYKVTYIPTIFFTVLSIIFATVFSYLTKIFIDKIIPSEDYNLLNIFIAVYLVINIFHVLSSIIKDYLFNKIAYTLLKDIRKELYDHVIDNIPYEYYIQGKVNSMLSIILNDTASITWFVSYNILQFLTDILQTIVYLGILFYLNFSLTFYILLTLPLYGILLKTTSKKIRKLNEKRRKQIANIMTNLNESSQAVKEIRIFNQTNYEGKIFGEKLNKYTKTSLNLVVLSSFVSKGSFFIQMIIMLFIFWYIGGNIFRGGMTLGTLIIFNTFLIKLFKPVERISNFNVEYQKVLASLERIFNVLDIKSLNKLPFSNLEKIVFPNNSKIIFDNVSFHYSDSKRGIYDISFTVSKNEKVAIIGPNGSGKSTIINLLCYLYIPQKGNIYVNNIHLNQSTKEKILKSISIIPQNTFFFNRSIKENLTYGNKQVDFSEIIKSTKIVDMHNLITNKFPDSYDSLMGEKGNQLSGGEKQRLSITRALIKNNDIVIMDEPTSSINLENDEVFHNFLFSLLQNKTAIIISHDTRIAEFVDRAIFIEHGKLKYT